LVLVPGGAGAPLRLVRNAGTSDLVVRCLSGEPDAQRELFERERARVHALLFRVVGSNAPMDDLIQDTFLEVFRSLSSFRGESSLGTWIDRCAVRVAYAHFARKKRWPSLRPVEDLVATAPSAEEHASMREAARRLYAALDTLEPRQRIAFTLFAIEGRSQQEIAGLMSSTLTTVKVRVWRARRALERLAREDALLSEFLSDDAPEEEDEAR
jgi:RNA polymerase sigma-70 factor (ECF subfamily)